MRTIFGSGLTFEAEASDLLYSVPTASSSEILDFRNAGHVRGSSNPGKSCPERKDISPS
jgi:hypothetical protein